MSFAGDDYGWDEQRPRRRKSGAPRNYICDDCYYRWVAAVSSEEQEEVFDEDGNLHFEDVPDEPAEPACPMCGSLSVSEN